MSARRSSQHEFSVSTPSAVSAPVHQRGEDTRGRILEAALELFAASGFEGASTRTIAERAGVNLPAIQYLFGSKEGLYRAVVEQFSQQMQAVSRRWRSAYARSWQPVNLHAGGSSDCSATCSIS